MQWAQGGVALACLCLGMSALTLGPSNWPAVYLPAVDAAIAEQKLDLSDPEFARLLQAATAGSSWERAGGVLRRVGAELTVLQPDTLARVRSLFASPAAAAAAGGGSSGWEVGPTTISAAGECGACGGRLQALDLTGEELAQFAEGIAAIAERQERRPNDFQQASPVLACTHACSQNGCPGGMPEQ